ncbi:MAG: hypothetical protein WDZ76_10515 [Pseudohongiellaceae bacterium]
MISRGIFTLAAMLASSWGLAQNALQDTDGNRDGVVTKDEFHGFVSRAGAYGGWDANSDGLIDPDEYRAIGAGQELAYWDADNNNFLDPYEVYNGMFLYFDTNQDGRWDVNEWNAFQSEGLFDDR